MTELEKLARHATDRLKERTKLPEGVISQLDREATRLSPELGLRHPGHFYLPIKDKHGAHAGFAAFKVVNEGTKPKLVLATILGPEMKPKGVSLSHLMAAPRVGNPSSRGSPIGKVPSQKEYTIRKTADGKLTCSCPAYKYYHGPKGEDCKHLSEYTQGSQTSSSLRPRADTTYRAP